jgi:lincosamide nucleotidyltransferase A/C/D/E
MSQSAMSASDVLALYQSLETRGIRIWIDGGWGVDALLGTQTRSHADLDIVIQEQDVASLRSFLEAEGFRDAPQPDTRAWNFVLADANGRKIDVHVVVLDADGNGIYGPPQNGQSYPASALNAHGILTGVTVRCTSPEFQMKSHSGFTLRDTDYRDVRALAEKFGLALPPDHPAPT